MAPKGKWNQRLKPADCPRSFNFEPHPNGDEMEQTPWPCIGFVDFAGRPCKNVTSSEGQNWLGGLHWGEDPDH